MEKIRVAKISGSCVDAVGEGKEMILKLRNEKDFRELGAEIQGMLREAEKGEVLKIKIDMWYEKKVDELPEF